MSLPKIALIGADGQLGTDLHTLLKSKTEVLPLYYPDFDLTHSESIRSILEGSKAEIVINTAAFNRVDECEDNPEAALSLKTLAIRGLSLVWPVAGGRAPIL